jgi:hypothetical protein
MTLIGQEEVVSSLGPKYVIVMDRLIKTNCANITRNFLFYNLEFAAV